MWFGFAGKRRRHRCPQHFDAHGFVEQRNESGAGAHDVRSGRPACEDDQPHVGIHSPNAICDLPTRRTGHDEIRDHDLMTPTLEEPDAFIAVAGRVDDVTHETQQVSQHVAYVRLIVDDQDTQVGVVFTDSGHCKRGTRPSVRRNKRSVRRFGERLARSSARRGPELTNHGGEDLSGCAVA